jgi:hypothetical protein
MTVERSPAGKQFMSLIILNQDEYLSDIVAEGSLTESGNSLKHSP